MFWDVLGCDIVDVINNSNRRSLLPKSMRSAILTLALKVKTTPTKMTYFISKTGDPFLYSLLII